MFVSRGQPWPGERSCDAGEQDHQQAQADGDLCRREPMARRGVPLYLRLARLPDELSEKACLDPELRVNKNNLRPVIAERQADHESHTTE